MCVFKLTSKCLWEPCSCQQETQEHNTPLEMQRGRGVGVGVGWGVDREEGGKKEAVHDGEQRLRGKRRPGWRRVREG